MMQQDYKIRRRKAPPFRPRTTIARETPSSDCFLDDQILDGLPNYSKSDFENPRLRQCHFDIANIDWEASRHIGGGLDGYSWMVFFGEEGPYVLKMFWDLEHPKHYFAPERECQNAAILAMMEASVDRAAAESTKIYLNPSPKTKKDAAANFYAFTEESLQSQSQRIQDFSISSVPRLRKCYGWLKISGRDSRIPSALWPPTLNVGKIQRRMSGDREHIAIVYEYIEEEANDPKTTEEVITFLWRAGFSFTNYPEERNWKGGVLLDLSEIVHVEGYGWKSRDFRFRDAARP
ncbi:hypothetical protein CEP51_012390 [Fusarium floridanum]|uniref:Uncharacterized protein n=1 Tax=Fusarium floridanum TaxID=1325733 RepID=A0A428QUZ9_9HYPO|nr:hypothetical protein CEP51_012390 [Fusarium floridanum]